ncbi:hypothetical protein HDZ31DRAFT_69779 [Schizophyllum fasciatum]
MDRIHNGVVLGVVSDWDLAIDVSKPQTHTGFEVTGTVPFMAIDLLSEEALSGQVKHLYRHDLEAMFYILVWVLCCYKDGCRLHPLPSKFDEWTQSTMAHCYYLKNSLLGDGWKSTAATYSWGLAERELAENLRMYFNTAYASREDANARWRKAHVRAQFLGGVEPSPLVEADEAEEVWAEFCGVVKTSIVDTISILPGTLALPPRLAALVRE